MCKESLYQKGFDAREEALHGQSSSSTSLVAENGMNIYW